MEICAGAEHSFASTVLQKVEAGGPGSGRRKEYDESLARKGQYAKTRQDHKKAMDYHASRRFTIETGPKSLSKENITRASAHDRAASAHESAMKTHDALGKRDDDASALAKHQVTQLARHSSQEANSLDN